MSFLLNLGEGLARILAGHGNATDKIHFIVHVNNWKYGDPQLPEYLGICRVTPAFLRDFKKLCIKHKCGERDDATP